MILITSHLSYFDTSKVISTRNMFYNCSKLVGGNETAYTIAHQNATYARIDGIGCKGYFTLKPTV